MNRLLQVLHFVSRPRVNPERQKLLNDALVRVSEVMKAHQGKIDLSALNFNTRRILRTAPRGVEKPSKAHIAELVLLGIVLRSLEGMARYEGNEPLIVLITQAINSIRRYLKAVGIDEL
jgi:hypothetical protein